MVDEYTWDDESDDDDSDDDDVLKVNGGGTVEIGPGNLDLSGIGVSDDLNDTSRPTAKLTVIYDDAAETVESDEISVEAGFGMNYVRFHDESVVPGNVKNEPPRSLEGHAEVVVTVEGETHSGVVRKAGPFKLGF